MESELLDMESELLEKKIATVPSIGFLGVGWIGRSRMESLISAGLGEGVAVCDIEKSNTDVALSTLPGAKVAADLDELLKADLDAVVIATPSALHASQSIRCLQAGKAVFCQKPLGRDVNETRQIIEEARRADRHIAVDFSYRYTKGMQAIKGLVESEDLGKIYAIETVFHNAYGPDKSWFFDPKLSGGGCLMDLGSHLVDLVLWLLNFPGTEVLSTSILSGARPVLNRWDEVEDYVSAELKTANGVNVKLGCSWKLPVGKDAEIYLKLYGTKGGAAFHNLNGSFYDFQSERYHGTTTTVLTTPPDDWGGQAIRHWAAELAKGRGYRPEAEELIKSAAVLDDIYKYTR